MAFAAALPWLIPAAISGISALGGFLGNRGSKASQTTEAPRDITQIPIYDPETLDLRNNLMSMFMDRARFNDDFISGYAREGINNINQSSDISSRAIENILSSRGLLGSSAGSSSLVQNALNRGNQQATFLNTLPMLRDERERSNYNDLFNFFKSLPTGYRQQGTTGSTTTTQNQGNPWAGLFGGLGTTLAGLYGQGAFGNEPKTASTPTFGNTSGVNYDIVPPGYKLPGQG